VRENVYRVEVLDLTISAGPGAYMLSDYVEVLFAIEFTTEHAISLFGNRPSQDVKVMTVNGDSMATTVNSGDRLFVDISIRHCQSDGVYAFVYGKTFHVKRLQMQGTRLAVLSDNPAYEKWYIDEKNQDQLYIMGKALLHESVKYNRLQPLIACYTFSSRTRLIHSIFAVWRRISSSCSASKASIPTRRCSPSLSRSAFNSSISSYVIAGRMRVLLSGLAY